MSLNAKCERKEPIALVGQRCRELAKQKAALGVAIEVIRRRMRRTVERAPADMDAAELVAFLRLRIEA